MRTLILITLFCGTTFTSSVLKVTKLSDESNTAAPYDDETISSTEINPIFLEGLNFDFEPKFTALNDKPSPTVNKCGESKEIVIQVEEPSDIQNYYPPEAPFKGDDEILKAANELKSTEEKATYIPPIENYSDIKNFSKPPQLPTFNLVEFVKNQTLSEYPTIAPIYEKPQTSETSIQTSTETSKPEMFIRIPDSDVKPQNVPSYLWTTQDVNENKGKFWNFGAPPVLPPLDYRLLFSKNEEASILKENYFQLPEPAIGPSSMSERRPELPQLTLPEHKPELPYQRLPHRPEFIRCNSEQYPLYPTHEIEQFEAHPNYNNLYPIPSIPPTSKPTLPPLKYLEPTKILTQENNEKEFQVNKNIPPGPTLPHSTWRPLDPKAEIVPSTEQPKTPTPTYIPPCAPSLPETTIAPETKLPTVTILPHIILPQPITPPVEIPSYNECNPHLPPAPQENYEKQSQVHKNIPPGPTLPHSTWKPFIPKSEIIPSTEQPKTPTYMPSPTPEMTIAPETKLPTVNILPHKIILPQPTKPPVEICPSNEYNPHHHHHEQTSEPCTLVLLLKKKCQKYKRS